MNWFKRAKEQFAKWKAQAEAKNEFAYSFTPRAQQALTLARQEAKRLNHNYVGTEHVLLGLIKLGRGVAFNVLKKSCLNLETLCFEVQQIAPRSSDLKLFGKPDTPRVKRILMLAQKEVKALNHTYVGTEHILLGLLAEGDGVAAQVLKKFNLNLEQLREEILKELDPNFFPSDDEQKK